MNTTDTRIATPEHECDECGEMVYEGEVCGCQDEDEEEESVTCSSCSGSGEGMHDGSTCSACGGSGEVRLRAETDDERWDREEWKAINAGHGDDI